MKSLSLAEFRSFCSGFTPDYYVFNTSDQDYNQEPRLINALTRYKKILITICPNSVCFMGDNSYICFERVRSVIVKKRNTQNGFTFRFFCGSTGVDENEVSYTITTE